MIENDPGRKVFRLTLDWEPLALKRDDLWYRRLGVEISEDAGRLLTFARTAGAFDLTSARLVTGLSGRASVTLVSQLVTRQLVEVDETDEETVYKLAPRLAELWERIDAPAHGRRAGAIEGISEGMTDRKARLADMIRQRPGLRGPQLSVALNLPASTVDRYLSQLRKEGRIEHRGARRTGGYFPRATKRT